MRTNIGIWVGFVLVSLASLVAYKTVWPASFHFHELVLNCLAVLAVLIGLVVLRQTGVKPWSLLAVVGGLLVGQWWFVKGLLVFVFAKWKGFAP
jgi:uncharacterized membrane protein YqgA involved in biofilm formation